MKWNLRLAAAQRGIWKASELQRRLAEHGLVISTGKMSGLWSATPASVKLDDLDVMCAVLGLWGRGVADARTRQRHRAGRRAPGSTGRHVSRRTADRPAPAGRTFAAASLTVL